MYIDGIGWVPDSSAPDVRQFMNPDGTVNQAALFAAQMAYNQGYNPEGDPSLGSNVVLPYGYTGGNQGYGAPSGTNVGTTLPGWGDTYHFNPGENPYFGFGDGRDIFFSADPEAIRQYQHDEQTRVNQGIIKAAVLVGGGAAAGAAGGAGAGSGAAGLETAPNGLLTGSASAAGGGVGTLSGAVPAVGAAPGIGIGAGLAGAELGPNGLPTGPANAAGGGVGTLSGGVPAVGAAPGLGAALGSGTIGGAVAGTSPWLTGLTIGSSIISGLLGDKAADAGVAASREAIDEAKRQYDTTRSDLLPIINLAGSAAPTLQKYLSGDRSVFTESPSYQFNLAEGQKAIDRSLAARGRALSGAGVREGVRYASGMASNEDSKFVDQLLAAAGLGTTGASAVGQVGQNTAANVGNAAMVGANARSSGYGAINNAVQGGVSNLLLQRYLGRP